MTSSNCPHELREEKHTAQKLQASNLTARRLTSALDGPCKWFLLLDQGYCKGFWGVSHGDLISTGSPQTRNPINEQEDGEGSNTWATRQE